MFEDALDEQQVISPPPTANSKKSSKKFKPKLPKSIRARIVSREASGGEAPVPLGESGPFIGAGSTLTLKICPHLL